jgi:hypothetical protein
MDAARQALRFSIPGSVLVLLTFGLVVASLALQEVHPADVLGPVNENVAALVGVLAVIPIGFLTYQAYYLGVRPIVWTSRLPRVRARPRIDRGASILSSFYPAELEKIRQLYDLVEFGGTDDPRRIWSQSTPLDADEEERISALERQILDATTKGTISVSRQDRLQASKGLKHLIRWIGGRLGMRELAPEFINRWPFNTAPNSDEEWKQARDFYELRWRTNWDLVVALIEAAAEYPDTASIKFEYTTLSDLYHALGACRTACSLAFSISAITTIAYVVIAGGHLGWLAVTISLSFVMCLGLWLLLNHSRRQTWRAASKMIRHGFRRLINRHPEFLTPVPIDPVSRKRRALFSRLRESFELASGQRPG